MWNVGSKFCRNRVLSWLWCLAWLGVLTGCAGLPSGESSPSTARLVVGSGHANFSLSGRLSLRDGQRIEIAGLRWERTKTGEMLTLNSPVGSTVARLWKGEDGIARLKSGDRESTAEDLETLIFDALGTPVPLRALGWWIQGLEPAASTGAMRETGASFKHDGWDIRIEEFPLNEQTPVARRVVARRGEVTLRLVIDQWEPRP